jgi:hypothetical protein
MKPLDVARCDGCAQPIGALTLLPAMAAQLLMEASTTQDEPARKCLEEAAVSIQRALAHLRFAHQVAHPDGHGSFAP